jgi:hypothetical protein
MCWLLAALVLDAAAAEPVPAFYVVKVHEGDSGALHSTQRGVAAGTELPYVMTEPKARIDCCFRVGAKPGARAKAKSGSESTVLYGAPDKEDKIYEYAGYVAGKGAAAANHIYFAFGISGMTGVKARGRDMWEVTLGQGAKPVFVRQCYGIEGIHMRLYRAPRDRTPYATYYVPLEFDTEPTCP